jgi:hypothetical protein
MTLNSNPTKTPSYCESGRLAQGGKHAFSFRSCEIYGLRERSINSPEVGILCGSCSLSILHAKTIAFEETI